MISGSGRALRMAYLVASIAGVAFFVTSVVLLAVWPGRVLEEQARVTAPEHVLLLSASEERGRAIYGREGCAYCHTQQIRYLHSDMARFGAPTLAWETEFDYPHLWGTRRIGPDLAREGSARSEDWQYAHLYAPRSLVADSVMPSYAWLFDGSPNLPRQEARDLVAYLDTLGRARALAGPEGEARARAACRCEGDMAAMAFEGSLDAHPARTRADGAVPVLPAVPDTARGQRLYAANCASCHGPQGNGDGKAAGLHPRPANLAAHEYSRERLADVLWNGVPGTAMQAWRDLPLVDLAALAETVRGLSAVPRTEPIPPDMLVRGEAVYTTHCAQCHGADGRGDGSAAAKQRIAPTDFHAQRPSVEAALRALRNGVADTPMAPWGARLNDDEMTAVTHYVRSLYTGDGSPPGARP